MKIVRYALVLMVLGALGFVDAKQLQRRSIAPVAQEQQREPRKPLSKEPSPQVIKSPGNEYEALFTTLKTLEPSAKDLSVLENIKNEADRQIKGVSGKAKPAVGKQRQHLTVEYGLSTVQNKRPYQEDRFDHAVVEEGLFFAVYDGHSGDQVSSFLKDKLHVYFEDCLTSNNNKQKAFECAFARAEEYALTNYDDGSTAVVAYIDKNDVLHCAWTGDSRAVLECGGKVCLFTDDHKPDRKDEKERIEKAGGSVWHHGVWRVNGLAVSRSIGDKSMKSSKGQIIAVPEYKQVQLTPDNHFLIIASDGIWDVIKNEEAVAMVNKALRNKQSLDSIAEALQNEAIKRGSGDNITVSVIQLNWNKSAWGSWFGS